MNERMQPQPTPEYTTYSNAALQGARFMAMSQLLVADLGYTAVQGFIFGLQVWDWLHGEREFDEIEWEPDVDEIVPNLVTRRREGVTKFLAINQELTLRRIHRQSR